MIYINQIILNILLHIKMFFVKHLLYKPLLKKTKNPQISQNKLLKDIIKRNSNTIFGNNHNFKKINDYQGFVKELDVNNYEDLRVYIQNEENISKYLNSKQAVIYAQTSGTTGEPKYIPILENTIKQYQKLQNIFSYALYASIPGVFAGKILSIVSPAIEGHMENGMPFGSLSGLLYKNAPKFMRSKFVVPYEVFEIEDYDFKYKLITVFSLIQKDISFMVSANPSTFLKILAIIHQYKKELKESIQVGSLGVLNASNINYDKNIQNYFKKNDARAKEIIEIFEKKEFKLMDIWPNLKAITTWTGGSCSLLIPTLKAQLSTQTKIVELGYLSSEFRGSITVDTINNICIPPLEESFFEFVEKDNWENNVPTYLTLEEIKKEKQYYILATTQNGLYRYFINDIIKVTDFYNKTPIIQFVQKGKGVTNITGEKLYESQLVQAMNILKQTYNVELYFYLMLADELNLQYNLYIEHDTLKNLNILEELEKNIAHLNIEYEAKRKSGRLKPINLHFLKKGTSEQYKSHCLAKGQREGQYKVVLLQYLKDCSFNFKSYIH